LERGDLVAAFPCEGGQKAATSRRTTKKLDNARYDNCRTEVYSPFMLGALIIDKPEGITSHDVVARVRRVAQTRRVGHAGTLDPFATGVLVVCVGRATRLVQFLVGLDKEYIATVRLGFATDTQDLTGKQITPLRSSNELSLEDLRLSLDEFTGPQLQTPPMFSAKKVGGERLYKAARAGREVPREPVNIVVHRVELIERDGQWPTMNEDGTFDFQMRVRCSSGTYVRTLANDIGARLGVGAHLSALRRTAVGHFDIAQSRTLNKIESMSPDNARAAIISPADMLSHLPTVLLDEARIKLVSNGRSFQLSQVEAALAEREKLPLKLCDREDRLVAVGDYDPLMQVVSPRVVLDVEDL
jgi:tRNA pseudouridine55 synthase